MLAGTVPLAVDNAAVAALGLASLVVGYALLAGLWYFVFSRGAERRAEQRRARRETAPEAPASPPPEPPRPALAVRRTPLRRPPRRRG